MAPSAALLILLILGSAHARFFSAVAVLEPPFVMYDENLARRSANPQTAFSGMALELLQAVVDRANRVSPILSNDTFQLNISLVTDGQYGAQFPNGSWSGAVGAVLSGQAAMGIGIFTINSARLASGVQFSTPFLSTGLGVLVRKEDAPPETWYFLVPFTAEVWCTILGAVVLACVSAWMLDRFSPYGYYWSSADPEDRRIFNLTNSLYGGLLTLTRKTPVRGAKAMSSRIVMISMYFMAFFMLNSYIAALTALIAVRDTVTTISSWTDIRDKRIPFGVTADSAAVDFFVSNNDPGIRGMASHMQQYDSAETGLARVRSGALQAFIADTQTLQYQILQPPCNLQVVGSTIDTHFLAYIFNESAFTPPFLLKPIIDSGIIRHLC